MQAHTEAGASVYVDESDTLCLDQNALFRRMLYLEEAYSHDRSYLIGSLSRSLSLSLSLSLFLSLSLSLSDVEAKRQVIGQMSLPPANKYISEDCKMVADPAPPHTSSAPTPIPTPTQILDTPTIKGWHLLDVSMEV